MLDVQMVVELEAECQPLFTELSIIQKRIRETLADRADGKNLKGNELVGWLGEIYGKILLRGALVSDREEHDVLSKDGCRVSIKTRKGLQTGWTRTSAIPKVEGAECPTHLLFVHLNNDYSLDRIWLFLWSDLLSAGRFKRHIVRKEHRSFIFEINERKDAEHIVYGENGVSRRATA